MQTPLLELVRISKRFGGRKAVQDLSFAVNRGERFGLLGPNGAGKSTTFRLLTGQIPRDEGEIRWLGQPINPNSASFRRRIGVVFQEPSLDIKLTARENLLLGAALYGLEKSFAQKRISDLLAWVELSDRQHERIETFSGGMRRRIEIARVLLHGPELLILDEPGRGVDLPTQRKIWQLLEEQCRTTKLTILLTTHQPEEAEYCDRVIIMNQGKMVVCAPLEELRRTVGGDVLQVESDEPEKIRAQLESMSGRPVQIEGPTITIQAPDAHHLIPQIFAALPKNTLKTVAVRPAKLSDVFVKLTHANEATSS